MPKTIVPTLPILVLALSRFVHAAPASGPPPAFDSLQAYRYLQEQCALGPRNPPGPGHDQGLAYLQERIAATFKRGKGTLQTQAFVHADMRTGAKIPMANLIARYPGANRAAKPILFCAHWDTRPRGEQDPDPTRRGQPIIGANDGASGAAVLLGLANLFAQRPPARAVYLAWFDGEDYGEEGNLEEYFLGAKYFADHPPAKDIEYAILLDMIGDRDLSIPYEANSLAQAPDLTRALWAKAKDLGLPAFKAEAGPMVYDDHIPLQRKGLKAVDLIDFDYPYWHTSQDLPEHCSAFSLGQAGRLLAAVAYQGRP